MALENIEVEPADVRKSLDNIPEDLLADDVLSHYITEEKLIVAGELPTDWETALEDSIEGDIAPTEAVELLVRRRAAREAFHSSPVEVRRQALDAAVSYDVQSFRGRLNRKVEKAYEILGLARGGSTAAFTDATSHAPGGGTDERLRRNDRPERRG